MFSIFMALAKNDLESNIGIIKKLDFKAYLFKLPGNPIKSS